MRHGYDGIDQDAFQPMVRVQVAGRRHCGWVQVPSQAPARPVAELATYRAGRHLRPVGT